MSLVGTVQWHYHNPCFWAQFYLLLVLLVLLIQDLQGESGIVEEEEEGVEGY